MSVNHELFDKIRNISNLPTLPQVASHLMRMINDPLTSSTDISALVSQDLSLSAKILRLANSAFYGIPHSITNINNAVVILGFKVIHTMVLSLTVFDMFPDDRRKTALFDRRAFWIHSLCCGLAAKMLAFRVKKFTLFDPDEAFCAGLLHDIGKVVMEQYMHEDFHHALETAHKKEIPLFDAEEMELGYTHSDVARHLISGWGLPQEIFTPIIKHHALSEDEEVKDITALCNLADWLCYETGNKINPELISPPLNKECLAMLKLSIEDIEDIKGRLPGELEKSAVYIDIAMK
ncbi:HDOD domain-containing protein [Chitinispirillales bacterium ANBcel5]|uniref:HDOD domain-containing protein n=1 Tax=Cellulosispirillum alkaliphilum TaxID=3039283 RepID=UPI002A51EDC1|nr:HDOD domain-containing protein [Chitinispirillales bacterium ANBcel5]